MRTLKGQDIPVVAVTITGRPLFVNPELDTADDFIVAWLPGPEGAGVADLPVAGADGERRFDFTGRLPTAWPGSANRRDTPYPFGHGLSLDSPRGKWTALDEDGGEAGPSPSVWFDKGVPTTSWSLEVGGGAGALTPVTTVPTAAAGGAVTVGATDFGVQEGARQFVVSEGEATIALSTRETFDIGAVDGTSDLLTFVVRVDEAPGTPPRLALNGEGVGTVLLDGLSAAAASAWRTYAVPLDCLAASDGDGDRSSAGPSFRLTTEGPATLSLARVALDETCDVLLDCRR